MWSVVVNGLAGAGGSIIAQIITYPLQTYRLLSHPAKNSSNTRLQSAHSPHFLVMSGAGEHPAADREGIYYYFYQLLKNISDDGLDIAYERLYRRISDRGCPTGVNDAERKQDIVGSSEMLVHVRGLLHPICVPRRSDLPEGFR
ncbi:hypothetical protein ZWY2020_034050 [Hordeum vulgare]|nr:hypothetical protein ZWY2020_034050 [Hordeum vulgare]